MELFAYLTVRERELVKQTSDILVKQTSDCMSKIEIGNSETLKIKNKKSEIIISCVTFDVEYGRESRKLGKIKNRDPEWKGEKE